MTLIKTIYRWYNNQRANILFKRIKAMHRIAHYNESVQFACSTQKLLFDVWCVARVSRVSNKFIQKNHKSGTLFTALLSPFCTSNKKCNRFNEHICIFFCGSAVFKFKKKSYFQREQETTFFWFAISNTISNSFSTFANQIK